MDIKTVSSAARTVHDRRADVEKAERYLNAVTAQFIVEYDGTVSAMAQRLGVSIGYLHDIRHGRRKVSDAVVEKLRRLK